MAGVDQQQLQPALLQHTPAGLPVLPRRLHHHLPDALSLQPIGQRLQAGGERRVGADLLAAASPTPTHPGRVRDADAGHHLVLADIQRPGAFHEQPRPPATSSRIAGAGGARQGQPGKRRCNACSQQTVRGAGKAPAPISDTGSHAPMTAELGRASPFSSVVAANGHGISDESSTSRWLRAEAQRVDAVTEPFLEGMRRKLLDHILIANQRHAAAVPDYEQRYRRAPRPERDRCWPQKSLTVRQNTPAFAPVGSLELEPRTLSYSTLGDSNRPTMASGTGASSLDRSGPGRRIISQCCHGSGREAICVGT
jgi:hypothetical protein